MVHQFRRTTLVRVHDWTPDGQLLVGIYRQTGRGWDLVTLASGESQLRGLVSTRANETYGRFSSDGRWLAYTSDVTGRSEIWIRSYPVPGEPMRVTRDGGGDPVWAPDDQELFYVEEAQEGFRVMGVSVQMGPEVRFGSPRVVLNDVPNSRGSFDVTPDGSFVKLQVSESPEPATAVVVQGWFKELKERVPVP